MDREENKYLYDINVPLKKFKIILENSLYLKIMIYYKMQ